MAKRTFFCVALILGVLLAANPVFSCETTVYGPKDRGIGWFRFHASLQSFKIDEAGEGRIEISKAGSKRKIRAGFVILNGQFISLHPILSSKAKVMEAAVSLRQRNFLFVLLLGDRGAGLTIKVMAKEKKAEQPPVNHPPVAVASGPSEAFIGDPVTLDGKGSSDPDRDQLTYRWSWVSYPEPFELEINNVNSAEASFAPLVLGDYVAELIVNDGKADSAPATVTVKVGYKPFSVTEQKLSENEGAGGDFFGSAVALLGDYALVGAYGKDQNAGAVYVFKWDGGEWFPSEVLMPDDGAAGHFFGSALALSDRYAVVGAYGSDTSGLEWLSRFGEYQYIPGTGTTWDEQLKAWKNDSGTTVILRAAAGIEWAENFRPQAIRISTHLANPSLNALQVLDTNRRSFGVHLSYLSGTSVNIDFSDRKDIGEIQAYFFSTSQHPRAVSNIEFLVPIGGPGAGAVYIYEHNEDQWAVPVRLTASDGKEGDAFGASVAVSDGIIIVGADRADDQGLDSGVAYVFVHRGAAWVEEAKLLASDGLAYDEFGSSVAVSGTVAVVGAPGANAAYVFRFDGEENRWNQEVKLAADDGAFGESVSISGNVAVVGAPRADAAYVYWYNGNEWTEEARLVTGAVDQQFGASVSVSNDYIVAGAPEAGGSGSFCVFKFDGSGWTLKGEVAASDGGSGQGFGSSVAIDDDAILAGAAGSEAAYAYTIDTYHAAGINAEPEIISAGSDSLLSAWWVNALGVNIEPDIGAFIVPPEGVFSASVTPNKDTAYNLTAYGPYGKDEASVTVFVK